MTAAHIHFFFALRDQIKLYHWQTTSYARHKATDEIIKELEERSGGRYAPSPGTVYPTLTMLEEMGYASSVEEGGRKVYAITEEGRKHLGENQTTVDDVFERLQELGASIFGDAVRPAHEAMGELGRAYWQATMRRPASTETVTKAAEILRRAAAELQALSNQG